MDLNRSRFVTNNSSAHNETMIDPQNNPNDESLTFIFVPLLVLGLVILLAAMVYLMASKRRKIFFRRRKVPSFSWHDDTSTERSGDEDEETYLLGNLSNVSYKKSTSELNLNMISRHNNSELYA